MSMTEIPDPVVAVVLVERDDVDVDPAQSKTTKLRIRQSDLVPLYRHCRQLTGEILYDILVSHDDRPIQLDAVEIYDSHHSMYRPLPGDDSSALRHCNLLDYVGTRLLVRLHYAKPKRQHSDEPLLAIEGRFYPYDGGITIGGMRIDVEEHPNEPGQGTAGNVWDGAVLL
jgi:hypothetical protein